ncbi:hypothetical protein LTR97_002384 [Elasticomyces elasticus]|uniref:RING-type E3 ubiquitin transferase n=1 Tax=Elasticomyces elasticus TaxID=574655 RepID=A0AAN7ZVL4_9PEZI|nr:hypothetical protein LTR97_002384 [Elasticomyces elasticus]
MSRHPPLAAGTAPPADDADDLDWLQYLQTAGNTVPQPQQQPLRSSSTSSDRKRRNNSTEHHARPHPYPNSTSHTLPPRTNDPRLRPNMSTAGSNPETAIDLTSPLPPPPPHPHRHPNDPRQRPRRTSRESEILLPKWQSDASALACPVCGVDFGFWNRRHHCRKCGRVVCATCSPHRITIPRQYVVQPPVNTYSHSDDGVEGMDSGRGVFGGEVVRVCNPCVPDPWTPENANVRGGGGAGVEEGAGVRARPLIEGARNASSSGGVPVLTAMDVMRAGFNRNMPPPASTSAFGTQEGVGAVRHRSLSHQPATVPQQVPQQALPPNLPTVSRGERYRQAVAAATTTDPRLRPSPAEHSRPISHRYSLSHNSPHPTRTAHSHASTSGTAASLPPVPAFPTTRPGITTTPSAPPPSQPVPRPLRREVREEDECPVCGMELPPGEQVRERHVEECIAARFSSTPSSSSMPRRPSEIPGRREVPLAYPSPATEVPPTHSRSYSNTSSIVPSGSLPSTTSTTTATRARAQSFRPRGMALYTATEKDCLDSSGEAVECVICLEEFQPGEAMGRMECLCKFHRGCIRGWWEAKVAKGGERGGCPTHVHYD